MTQKQRYSFRKEYQAAVTFRSLGIDTATLKRPQMYILLKERGYRWWPDREQWLTRDEYHWR